VVQSKKQELPPAQTKQQSDGNEQLSHSECNHPHSFIPDPSLVSNDGPERFDSITKKYPEDRKRIEEEFRKLDEKFARRRAKLMKKWDEQEKARKRREEERRRAEEERREAAELRKRKYEEVTRAFAALAAQNREQEESRRQLRRVENKIDKLCKDRMRCIWSVESCEGYYPEFCALDIEKQLSPLYREAVALMQHFPEGSKECREEEYYGQWIQKLEMNVQRGEVAALRGEEQQWVGPETAMIDPPGMVFHQSGMIKRDRNRE
jgi:DNA repair exonuclease SbcCD ATPase subunit